MTCTNGLGINVVCSFKSYRSMREWGTRVLIYIMGNGDSYLNKWVQCKCDVQMHDKEVSGAMF